MTCSFRCDEDINECEPDPFQNNATGDNLIGRYFCNCTEDFVGVDCENRRRHLRQRALPQQRQLHGSLRRIDRHWLCWPTVTLATVRLVLMESTARIPSIIVPFSILVVTAPFALAFLFDDLFIRGRCLNSPCSYSCLCESVDDCGSLIIQDSCFSNFFGESRPFCILLRPCWKGNMSVLNFCVAVCVLGFIIIFAFFLCWLLYHVQQQETVGRLGRNSSYTLWCTSWW